VTWLLALGFVKRAGGAVWRWLTHASFWQLVSLALACFAIVQHFQIADARHDAASYAKQRDALKAELDAISSKRNEQKAETGKRIVVVKEQIRHADTEAKRIEQAELPGQCKSPKEVIDADI
jgi:hypothetical protein